MQKYVDEEDLLGFHVFLAELELLIGNRKDEVSLSELLQKLYLSIDHTELRLLKKYQRRGEQALVSLLERGASSEVRELLCLSLSKLYTVGDKLPIFAQVNAIQGILLSKDAFSKKMDDKVKLGLLNCLSVLCCDHGMKLSSNLSGLISVAVKHANRTSISIAVRLAALRLVSAAIHALGPDPRYAVTSQAEGLKLADKYSKPIHPEEVKIAAIQIVQSVARAGGIALWVQGAAPYEEIFKLVLSGLHETSTKIRDTSSEALGELLAVTKSLQLQEVMEKEMRENKKQNLVRLINRSFADALSSVFVESAALNKKTLCIGVVKAWVSCISVLSFHTTPEEQDLVQYSIEFVSMLSRLQISNPELKSRNLLEMTAELGSGLATGEFPMAQACVIYALRTGVFRKLSESGQRKLTDQLGLLLASVIGKSVPTSVCSLEGIRVLLGFLGEVSPETASDLGITFMEKLTSPSAAVRSQAAAALGSLVRVDPACAATMITSANEFLKNAIDQLISLSAPYGAMHPLPLTSLETLSFPTAEEASKKDQDSAIRDTMHAVYGYATGMASLIVAAASSVLSVPSKLYEEAYIIARNLILSPKSTLANSWAVEMKAGYCILGALCIASVPCSLAREKKESQFLELWEPALGATAQAILLNKTLQKSGKELDLALQLWWRSEALLALEAYIQSSSLSNKAIIQKILSLITPILKGLTASFNLNDPNQIQGGPAGWVASTLAYLQLRLLKIFQLIPDTSFFSDQYSLLVQICSQPFSSLATFTSSVACGLSSVVLRGILNSADHVLGPWEMEEEPMEEKLNLMTGEKGAPHYAGWECGMFVWGVGNQSPLMSSILHLTKTEIEPKPFPQYTSLPIDLIQTQLSLFGHIFAQVPHKSKVQLLETLLETARKAKSVKNPQIQEALLSTVCCVLLSGMDGKQKFQPSAEVGQKIVELSTLVLDSGIKSPVSLTRASAEILSLAGVIAGDQFSLKLVKKLASDLSNANSQQQCFLLLAIGCLFRCKGGMCLQTALPELIKSLFSLFQEPNGRVLFWTLHCLCQTSTSAGLTYMPYVKTTLQLMQQLMMSDLDVRRLRPFVGRLTNAMVAVLGPELYPGSRNYLVCKCLMRQMQGIETERSFMSALGASPGSLERVLYAQQLILFAPQAVPAEKHIGMLLTALTSPHPSLRFNSVITLRHLTERDPQAICEQGIEKLLFHALDVESEMHISNALHLTLETLQSAQCLKKPSIWLDVCASVVLMMPRESRSDGKESAAKEGSLMEAVDEGEDEKGPTKMIQPKKQKQHQTPRLKTRTFACRCLLRTFEVVGTDPRHFDLIKARQTGDDATRQDAEFLVSSLEEIVKLGFSLATGPVEALQPEGIKLLNAVILHFGEAEDPDVSETKLLFQFQAQFISPLRQALSPAAPPLLFMAGSTLAVSFLRSGLGGSDAIVLKQLVGLLVEPIQNWSQLRYRNFSEWVSSSVRVSLLEAHAHCTVLAETKEDPLCSEIVLHAQEPVLRSLKGLWMALLTDFMVMGKPRLWTSYQPSVIFCFDRSSSQSQDKEKKNSCEDAWPVILKALSLRLPAARDILSGKNSSSSDHPSSSPRMERIKTFNPSLEGLMDSDLADFYWRLLDITTVHLGASSVNLIEQAKSEEGFQDPNPHNVIDVQPICTCLSVLKKLLAEDYTSMSLCPVDVFLEVLEMILSILQQVLHPILCSLSEDQLKEQERMISTVFSITDLLMEVGTGLKNHALHQENFISAFLDCVLGSLSLLTPVEELPQLSHHAKVDYGMQNSLKSLQLLLQAVPWEICKNGVGMSLQHLMRLLKSTGVRQEVVSLLCEVMLEVHQLLLENARTFENGNNGVVETLNLSMWMTHEIYILTKNSFMEISLTEDSIENAKQELKLAAILTMSMKLESSLSIKAPEASKELRNEFFAWLGEYLGANQTPEMQLIVLRSLKSFLQDATTLNGSVESNYFLSVCVVELTPHIVSLVHDRILALQKTDAKALQVVAEGLKFMIVALSVPSVQGKENLIFQALIPLLIEAMECPSSEELQQMSMKLTSHLNTTHPNFKTTVNALPLELKQRFQTAIQNSAGVETKTTTTTIATTGESTSSSYVSQTTTTTTTHPKPTIVLKNFALR